MKHYISLCNILVPMCILFLTACGTVFEPNKAISETVTNVSNTIKEDDKESSEESESPSSETATEQRPITIDDVYTLLSNGVPANTIQNVTMTEEAKNAFTQYLSEQDYLYGISFADTNADGNEEMIVSINPYGLTDIVYYESGSINTVHIETASDRGLVRFLTDTNGKVIVINRYDYGNHTTDMGCQLWYIYTNDDVTNMLSVAVEYFRMSYDGYVEDFENADKYYGDAYLNGQLITEQQSNDLLEYLNEICEDVPSYPCKSIHTHIADGESQGLGAISYEDAKNAIEDILDS